MGFNNIQEAKGVIAGIVKENDKGGGKVLTVSGTAITFSSTNLDSVVFLAEATSYAEDDNKTVNKTDIVGSENQKVTEGSIENTFSYESLAVEPESIGQRVIQPNTTTYPTVYGLTNDATTKQYVLTTFGQRKLLRSGNTFTVRIWYGCDLDSEGNADITTATEVVDIEDCHISSNSINASGGATVTASLSFDGERKELDHSAYNTKPN